MPRSRIGMHSKTSREKSASRCSSGTTALYGSLPGPASANPPEVKRGFLWLACEVRQALASIGVTELLVSHALSLRRFGEILEQEGFLSKELLVVRTMHFTEPGDASPDRFKPLKPYSIAQ